jgi:hypothetical protein
MLTGYRGIRDSPCCNRGIGLGIRPIWMHSHWWCHHVFFRLGRSSHDDWQILLVSLPRSDRLVSMDCGPMYGSLCRRIYRHSEYCLFVHYVDLLPDISQRLAHDWVERNALVLVGLMAFWFCLILKTIYYQIFQNQGNVDDIRKHGDYDTHTIQKRKKKQ